MTNYKYCSYMGKSITLQTCYSTCPSQRGCDTLAKWLQTMVECDMPVEQDIYMRDREKPRAIIHKGIPHRE